MGNGTVILEMDPNSIGSTYSFTSGMGNTEIIWGIKGTAASNTLLHEMMHLLQSYMVLNSNEYNRNSLNFEIEASKTEIYDGEIRKHPAADKKAGGDGLGRSVRFQQLHPSRLGQGRGVDCRWRQLLVPREGYAGQPDDDREAPRRTYKNSGERLVAVRIHLLGSDEGGPALRYTNTPCASRRDEYDDKDDDRL